MLVNRESFLRILESVQPGLSPRETMEQTTCFVFYKDEVVTFNEEVACRMPSGLKKTVQGAVPALPLLEILRKIPEEEIEVSTNPDAEGKAPELLLKGKGRRSGIRMEAEIFLPVDAVERPSEWLPLSSDFGEAVNLVHQCTSTDRNLFNMNCVHIHPKWVEATDNVQMGRWKIKTGVEESVFLTQKSIKHVGPMGATEFAVTNGWMHFKNGMGLVVSCRRHTVDYPSLSECFKVEGKQINLPKGLVEAATVAEFFSKQNTDVNVIKVDLIPGRIKVFGKGLNGWHQEVKKVNYDGDSMSFYASPKLLTDLVKRHPECIITKNRIKVTSGTYSYVMCMTPQEDEGS